MDVELVVKSPGVRWLVVTRGDEKPIRVSADSAHLYKGDGSPYRLVLSRGREGPVTLRVDARVSEFLEWDLLFEGKVPPPADDPAWITFGPSGEEPPGVVDGGYWGVTIDPRRGEPQDPSPVPLKRRVIWYRLRNGEPPQTLLNSEVILRAYRVGDALEEPREPNT
ncbi:MAG TPA: hypothetical protein VMR44_10370 [Thermoanaerobaculia bacterium]|nr:hypothetical protein [Thermoanaerobaculia bacterium]